MICINERKINILNVKSSRLSYILIVTVLLCIDSVGLEKMLFAFKVSFIKSMLKWINIFNKNENEGVWVLNIWSKFCAIKRFYNWTVCVLCLNVNLP